jgi:hypothetical protein
MERTYVWVSAKAEVVGKQLFRQLKQTENNKTGEMEKTFHGKLFI